MVMDAKKSKSRAEMMKDLKMPAKKAADSEADSDVDSASDVPESEETPADEAAESPETQAEEAAEGTEEHGNPDLAHISDDELLKEAESRGLISMHDAEMHMHGDSAPATDASPAPGSEGY